MATEFVCTVGSGGDYAALWDGVDEWQDEVGCNLTSALVMVYDYVSVNGAGLSPGDEVTGSVGEDQATVIAISGTTSGQVLIEHEGSSEEFVNNEQIEAEDTDYVTLSATATDDRDTAIAVAEITGNVTIAAANTISAFTTDEDNYYIIRPVSGDEATAGSFDTGNARITVAATGSLDAITLTDNYGRVENLQIDVTCSTAGATVNVFVGAGTDLQFNGCRWRDSTTSSTNLRCMQLSGADNFFQYCIFELEDNASGATTGIYATGATNHIYNCTVYGQDTGDTPYGVYATNASSICRSTICANVTNTISGGLTTVSHCMTDGSTPGTSGVNLSGAWTDVFEDPDNGDFTLAFGDIQARSRGMGPDSSDSDVPRVDIAGTVRIGGTCDIGAWEETSATDFVNSVSSAGDYATVSAWESALNTGAACVLSSVKTRVYNITSVTGTVSLGAEVDGDDNSYTATVRGLSSTQVLVYHDAVDEVFANNEVLEVDVSNYITLTATAGDLSDMARAVAELDGTIVATTAQVINAFTSNVSAYPVIRPVAGDEATAASFNTSNTYLSIVASMSHNGLDCQDLHTHISNLQIRMSGSGDYICAIVTGSSADGLTIEGCRIDDAITTSFLPRAIVVDSNVTPATIRNTIITMGSNGTDSERAISCGSPSVLDMYNCVVFGDGSTSWGVIGASTGTKFYNCAMGEFGGAVAWAPGAMDTKYNLTDNGSYGYSLSGDWDTVFTDPDNGDFTLLSTDTQAIGKGIGPSADSSAPTTDMEGDVRSGATCDIGADEYEAAGATPVTPTLATVTVTVNDPTWSNSPPLATVTATVNNPISASSPLLATVTVTANDPISASSPLLATVTATANNPISASSPLLATATVTVNDPTWSNSPPLVTVTVTANNPAAANSPLLATVTATVNDPTVPNSPPAAAVIATVNDPTWLNIPLLATVTATVNTTISASSPIVVAASVIANDPSWSNSPPPAEVTVTVLTPTTGGTAISQTQPHISISIPVGIL